MWRPSQCQPIQRDDFRPVILTVKRPHMRSVHWAFVLIKRRRKTLRYSWVIAFFGSLQIRHGIPGAPQVQAFEDALPGPVGVPLTDPSGLDAGGG